jgi:hypothetical protein
VVELTMSVVTRDLPEDHHRVLAEVHRLREDSDDLRERRDRRERLVESHGEIEQLPTRLITAINPSRVVAPR